MAIRHQLFRDLGKNIPGRGSRLSGRNELEGLGEQTESHVVHMCEWERVMRRG